MFRFTIPRGRDFWIWPPTTAVLLVLVIFFVTGTARVLKREWLLRKERQALEQRIQELKAERVALEERIRELETPGGVERLAKEKLGLKLEGEEVVIVLPDSVATSAPAGPSTFWVRLTSFLQSLIPR